MENYFSAMPLWVSMLFIVSFLLSLTMIVRPARQAALNAGLSVERSKIIQRGIIFFYLLWLGYASALALTGVLDRSTLPPRVMIFITLPLFIILLAFVGNTRLYKQLLRSATLESLIFMHVFRFVGIFFFVLYFYNVLDPHFAVSAGLGDIITALFAIPVARAVAQKKSWAVKAVYVWNIVGILDILTLLSIATYGAIKAAGAGVQGGGEMTMFPFVWFPAFAPGTILFLHAGVFRKLRQRPAYSTNTASIAPAR
jgi:hypothetical protein